MYFLWYLLMLMSGFIPLWSEEIQWVFQFPYVFRTCCVFQCVICVSVYEHSMDLWDCTNSWHLPYDLYSIIFTFFTICSRIKLWAEENPVAIFSRGEFDRQCQVFTKLLGGKKSGLWARLTGMTPEVTPDRWPGRGNIPLPDSRWGI